LESIVIAVNGIKSRLQSGSGGFSAGIVRFERRREREAAILAEREGAEMPATHDARCVANWDGKLRTIS
jgi:hypothetical protein